MSNRYPLNLPASDVRVRVSGGVEYIWDDIRKRWLKLTPEEWVRQNFIHFLCRFRGVDPVLISEEYQLKLNGTTKRADIVVFTPDGKPWMVVECKAPSVAITRETLEQAARYNIVLKVPYVAVTNGLSHYCFSYCAQSNTTEKIGDIPTFGNRHEK